MARLDLPGSKIGDDLEVLAAKFVCPDSLKAHIIDRRGKIGQN